MRVLAVTPYYEPEGGGLERYAHAVLQRLRRDGHDVEACAFTNLGLGDDDLDGVWVHRFTPARVLGNTPVDRGFGKHVQGVVDRFQPDVILTHTPVPFPAFVAARIARRNRIPLVTTYHAGSLRGSNPALQLVAQALRVFVEPHMLRQSARLIAVSPYVRDHALRRYRAKTSVIPPGVDLAEFRPADGPPGSEILFVGPLDNAYRWKGLDVLRAAFRLVRRTHPQARLVLVGDGDRRQEMAEDGVEVRGRLSREDLAAAYRQAAVTVLPSTTDAEAFGMVLAEANASGRPVIGSRVGGIPDFIEDGVNGLLVPPGDAEALAEALRAVLDDPGDLGKQGRAKVVAHHGWDELAVATEAILMASVKAPAPRRADATGIGG